ncbi:MAG: sulfatase-like hydrolase/transferase [Vicinamibacteria bacterium]|nr:sulfatase-like hydrolase/transferase [Vicinamibacteria bacterium]
MKTLPRSALAGFVVTLILAATETVAGYPRPSAASGAFFAAAFIAYLPVAVAAAWALATMLPAHGLDLWLPFLVGLLRVSRPLAGAAASRDWSLLALSVGAVGILLALRARTESKTQSPPFLFGLTVGIVLPILMGRVATATRVSDLVGQERALSLGVVAGLLAFVLLRAFVARWPKVGPVFLLGPIVSLGLWSRPPFAPAPPAGAPPMPAPARRPDIVLVVLDTVRAQALASYGHARDTMPNLEAFARRSTTFRRAWTDASWTLPAHASLFSGVRPGRHRYDSGFDAFERASPDLFLAARLRRAGYATAAVAANFGVFGGEGPLLRGFERVEAEPLRPYAFHPWFFDIIGAFPRAPGLRSLASGFPGPSMRAPWVVDRALDFWRRPEARPRFLFVNLMEAHLPWIPEERDLGRFGPAGLDTEDEQGAVLGRYLRAGAPTPVETEILRARYDEALSSLDRSLGRLLDAVADRTGGGETIVVVTSDHGESLGEHARFGHRNSLDEAATRIPLILNGPGLKAGAVRDTPVQLVDVFGYLAQSAGVALEPGLDSRNFSERRAVVMEHRPGAQGDLPASYPRGDLSALVLWPFKYIEGPHVESALFDLEQDPGEVQNLAAREPEQARAMSLLLRQLAGPGSVRGAVPDPAAEERLRALGYVR